MHKYVNCCGSSLRQAVTALYAMSRARREASSGEDE